MATARMHRQRTVKRGYNKARYTRQRKIKRGGNASGSPATSAVAGIPGYWNPPNSTPPATVAALIAGTPNVVTASPTTAWTGGQFVQTATAGASGRATWTGTAWVGGVAPGMVAVEAATIAEVQSWVDENPSEADEVLAAEQARTSPRVTLVSWLQGFISDRDEGHIP